jgi:hypothetical protein
MVQGIDQFRKHFEGYEESYALIGGSACHLIFEEVGVNFRSTRDIDMVLRVDVVDLSFAKALKSFLDQGGYQARVRSAGRREFYRFEKPTDDSYPDMLELFSTKTDIFSLEGGDELATVEVADDVLSLSAILLEPDYYDALIGSKRAIQGISLLDETLLIPFKARAFVDLSSRREKGDETVKGVDIKKHRNDVFRLMQLLAPSQIVDVKDPLKDDLRAYVDRVSKIGSFKPTDFDVPLSREEGLKLLTSVYQL